MTIDVRGTATVECWACGHEIKHDISWYFNKFGWDTSKWGDGWKLECPECEYKTDISDGICVIETKEE